MSEESSCDVCYLFIFFLLCLSSFSIGQWISHYKLLALTGYLIVGILAGPWILNVVKPHDIERLEWLDRLAMALISLTAGAELYYPHLVVFLPTLKRIVASLAIVGFALVFLVGWAASPLVDYMQDVGAAGKVRTLSILSYLSSCSHSLCAGDPSHTRSCHLACLLPCCHHCHHQQAPRKGPLWPDGLGCCSHQGCGEQTALVLAPP